ncbi:MAG TPA: PTS sugar transporter subunit IIA [Tepidisphaeraceae bacterium]|jgi:two-component system sensor histidine kinase KdpD|nr:PTS sugar transporter subunit IIA [Tepidisphaeraceae bacterium]
MAESRASTFLHLIRRSERGRLKIYLGYGPGVGKTYQMLLEAHRLKAEGIDVVIGLVETHNRPETIKQLGGLEQIPRRQVEYHGIVVEEFDVDACLVRKPQVVLVDELAHTNVPGSRNGKRYEDVQELLAAGIHVITALNVQHLESLYNTVEGLIGVKVRERIPDSVLADADQVVNIDLSPEDLQKRLEDGKIYPKERIASSLDNFFQSGNLEHLRELALRELASQIDSRRREARPEGSGAASDQIMVCLSSRGPNSARLLRFGSRLAGRLNRNWYAVYVQTPSEEPTVIDAVTQRLLAETLTLANQLGATVFTFKGQDVAATILQFAREYHVGQVVIGKPRPISWWKHLVGERSVAERLIFGAEKVTIIVVDAESQEHDANYLSPSPTSEAIASVQSQESNRPTITNLLKASRIRIWQDPVSKEQILSDLLKSLSEDLPNLDLKLVRERILTRESQGSTFLNEGIALPHARIDDLATPQIAVGVTHGGVLDSPAEKPIEVVFLLLSPSSGANIHLQLLATAGRAFQNRDLRRGLREAATPSEVEAIIRRHLA